MACRRNPERARLTPRLMTSTAAFTIACSGHRLRSVAQGLRRHAACNAGRSQESRSSRLAATVSSKRQLFVRRGRQQRLVLPLSAAYRTTEARAPRNRRLAVRGTAVSGPVKASRAHVLRSASTPVSATRPVTMAPPWAMTSCGGTAWRFPTRRASETTRLSVGTSQAPVLVAIRLTSPPQCNMTKTPQYRMTKAEHRELKRLRRRHARRAMNAVGLPYMKAVGGLAVSAGAKLSVCGWRSERCQASCASTATRTKARTKARANRSSPRCRAPIVWDSPLA